MEAALKTTSLYGSLGIVGFQSPLSVAVSKFSLIDLEGRQADRAQGESQRERLSERTLNRGCDSLISVIERKAESRSPKWCVGHERNLGVTRMDLMEHDGKMPESTFLRILPGQVDAFLSNMKQMVSVHLLSGPHFATVTDATNAATGIMVVDRIDRFVLSQKVSLDDDDSVAASYYVTAINVDAKSVTLSATRGGGAANVSAYSVAQAAKFYHPGAQTTGMTSLRSQLLSLANGGSTNLFGVAKTSAPFLQCPNVDGSGINATNILDEIFDAYTERQILAKGGKAPKVVMSYANLGAILKLIEVQKGAFNVIPNSRKSSHYGWTEIEVGSVSQHALTLVGVQEMNDSEILMLDLDSLTFFSNGMFKRRKAPDGKEYFESRATTGYTYILDHCLFGKTNEIEDCRLSA